MESRDMPKTSLEAYKSVNGVIVKKWYDIMRAYSKQIPDKLLFKYIGILLDLKTKDEAKYSFAIKYMGLDDSCPVWRNIDLTNLEGEYWKNIPNYPHYKASSLGRFKSISRVIKDAMGRERLSKDKILPQSFDRSGYLRLCVHVMGKQSTAVCSRLLGAAFIKNKTHKKEVNHKIGIKPLNPIWNLEWNTPSENQIHAFENSLQISMKGQKNGMATISNETALKIFKDTRPSKEVANHFMVRVATVTRIRSGILWSSVTGKIHKKKVRNVKKTA